MNNKEYEKKAYDLGYHLICGVDEVGRGSIAGPVCACAVIMKEDSSIEGITDSKKLTDKARRKLYDLIIEDCISYQVAFIDEKEIDEINILEASRKAMTEAINHLKIKPDYILTDAMDLNIDLPYQKIIHGDLLSYTISCASILAKVTRDNLMIELAQKYPGYGWEQNKGYPTPMHKRALKECGLTPHHRLSYLPVKEIISEKEPV